MTARQIYEGVLIELNKVQAPSLLLEDFNYLFNKAIYLYINKKYNIYDINQQSTDDVRVLKTSAELEPVDNNPYDNNDMGTNSFVTKRNALYSKVKIFALPTDYLHLLNCICNFKVKKTNKCYNEGDYVQFPATRLTADAWSKIINNFYMRPMYKRPYYYINNVNTPKKIVPPTNPMDSTTNWNGRETGTDALKYKLNYVNQNTGEDANTNLNNIVDSINSNLPRDLIIKEAEEELAAEKLNLVEREAGYRYGNSSSVFLEIRYGKDDTVFELENIWVDYIKAPQHIRLTQEQLDLTEDTSQMMEFPDYVNQEIINELVKIVMENSGDPTLTARMPNHQAVSQSIANPAQALTTSK